MRRTILLILLGSSLVLPAHAENLRETPVVKAIRKTAPQVVNIGTEQAVMLRKHPFFGTNLGPQMDAYYNNFLNSSGPVVMGKVKVQSLGSGVIVSPDGLIITNSHVVGMASKIFVTRPGGKTEEAVLIGTDNANDMALIQIRTDQPIPYLELTDDVMLGETVISIGSPLGLENSVSAGIISGLNRTFYTTPQIEAFKNLIQTDAPINQGSSGGALVNLEGKLVGMNCAMIQDAQGVGFAIPASKIKKMLAEYRKFLSEQKKKPATAQPKV